MPDIEDLAQITVESLRQFQYLAIVLIIIMQLFGKRIIAEVKRGIVWLIEYIAKRGIVTSNEDAIEAQDMMTNITTLLIGAAITLSLRSDTYKTGDAWLNALFASLLASGLYEYVKNVVATKGYKWK